LRNAVTKNAMPLDDPLFMNPTTGIADCCARAASGHAGAPPSTAMNERLRQETVALRDFDPAYVGLGQKRREERLIDTDWFNRLLGDYSVGIATL
jgi:hypothetical protein